MEKNRLEAFSDGVLAIYWVNHHLIFQKAETVNIKILWCNIGWLFVMSLIPFATAWVGTYPTSWMPLTLYFADMALAAFTFHQMYYLIAVERGEKKAFKLSARNIISMVTYTLAAAYDRGKLIGECEFSPSEKMWIISHTGVREAYEGKGIARKLVLKVIEAARAKGVKICPLCPYAKKLMSGKEEFKDVM